MPERDSAYNRRAGLMIVCPVTNQSKGYPFEVAIPAGLPITGVILSDQLKSMDWNSRKVECLCELPDAVMTEVVDKAVTLIDPEESES
jgi:mRNA interferase MazF